MLLKRTSVEIDSYLHIRKIPMKIIKTVNVEVGRSWSFPWAAFKVKSKPLISIHYGILHFPPALTPGFYNKCIC